MADLIEQLGWVDLATLIILAVFFVLGIFRGFVWQVSRFLTIILGYVLAGLFAKDLANFLTTTWPGCESFALIASWFGIFTIVLIALSAIAWMLTGFLKKLKLGTYDRLGGGIVGGITGAAIVVVILAILYALPTPASIIQATEKSRTKRFTVTTLTFFKETLKLDLVKPVLHNLNRLDPAPANPQIEPEKNK